MPVVDEEDAVLPSELQGKSAAEIAAYYASREETILANARRMVTEAQQQRQQDPAPQDPAPPRENDKPITRDEFNRMTATAQGSLISMAKMTAKEGKPDWDRFAKQINDIVGSLPPDQQMNSEVWTECYYNVRGRFTDTIVKEARDRALGLEPPSPPPITPEKPRQFTDDELAVVQGLGVTTEMYVDAEKKLDAGYQPFTTNNQRGARR